MNESTLSRLRNVGISAHIDSGKTTLTERILYYAGRIHKIQEVKGKDGDGATMDHMELEKERGITITSAATQVKWDDTLINIIDTPGHVDFTIEVERSLRVLDGAILVLCGVAGVQSQSITVDRQMKRYQVPRICFINKLDRQGADPVNVIKGLEEKLDLTTVQLQLPIGLGNALEGIVDLIRMKAAYFDGDNGERVRWEEIPANLAEEARSARTGMLDALSLYDDELLSIMLEEKPVPEELVHAILRRGTIAGQIAPVLMGSAYKNKGVQLLLEAMVRYLPSPLDREIYALDMANDEAEVPLEANPDGPLIALAFKLVDETFGQLTFMRIYQGKMVRGDRYTNARTRKEARFSRILRMHANDRQDLDSAEAGDIVAVVGLDCISGDTFCGEDVHYAMESMHVMDPVISLAVSPAKTGDRDKFSKALGRFAREDPTFHVSSDQETGETIISGMGELHLDVYCERIRREYKVELNVGQPKVSYRESPSQAVEYNYKHRKQTGGSGQYAHVVGKLEPLPENHETGYEFENNVFGGRIPSEYIPSVDKGFQSMLAKGPLGGFQISGVKMILEDGTFHAVDSSDMAFQICARDAFREAFLSAKPILLEPIMKVQVECPNEFQGSIIGDLSSRRGLVMGTENRGSLTIIDAEVPLARMFGYATDVRSQSQGKASFTMEFLKYKKLPAAIQAEVLENIRLAKSGKAPAAPAKK
ncbi:MAG TPA: elongation factor G [Phycisphaerae bacterium]|nr:elongation factor G [Phycisphaerae bacterium]